MNGPGGMHNVYTSTPRGLGIPHRIACVEAVDRPATFALPVAGRSAARIKRALIHCVLSEDRELRQASGWPQEPVNRSCEKRPKST